MTSQTITFGLHSVDILLQKNHHHVIRICVQQGRHDKKIESLLKLAALHHIPVETLPKQTLDQMTNAANHQGIIAVCEKRKQETEYDLDIILQNINTPPFILVLDNIQDPHNLGACLRSANAAGVHAVIAPKDNAVGLTPVVSKVASGAAEATPFIQVTNLSRTLEKLKEMGIWIYGAAGEAEQNLFQTNLSGPIAIVLGAEGSGLRRLTREHCDVLVNIPMHGIVSSLNVSVATGIFLFEVVRQRNQK